MSELKVYHHELRHNEYEEFYLKYEADKVIAEKDAVIAKLKAKLEGAKNETNFWCNNLKVFAQKKDAEIAELKADYKESCDRLQTANLIKDEQIAATRHSKHKRCLAMAMWCCDACDKWMMRKAKAIGLGKDGVKEYHQARRKLFHYMRWQTRWLKIAEKFKEGV